MVRLLGPDLDALIYPMDVLISGRPVDVTRARAAIASRLTTASAHLTVSAEAQEVEDRIRALTIGDKGPTGATITLPMHDADAEVRLAAIDESLARIQVPYDEWETLYRQRLQVERDLRARSMAHADAEAGDMAAGDPGTGQVLRTGAGQLQGASTPSRTRARARATTRTARGHVEADPD